MIDQHKGAGSQEDRVGEFYDGEAAEVEGVDHVAAYAEEGGEEREGVDEEEEELDGDGEVYESRQGFLGEDGVFFYYF